MSKYVYNAVNFLGLAFLLVVILGSCLNFNEPLARLNQEVIEALPLGKYIQQIYYVLFENEKYVSDNSSVSIVILDVVKDLMKLVVAWFIYRLAIRNAISILMVSYCDGLGSFFDRLKSEILYNIGFILSSLLANYLLLAPMDKLFDKLGTSIGAIWAQIITYGIFTTICVLLIVFVFSNKIFKKTIFPAIIDGLARVILCISYFNLLHYFAKYNTISIQIILIIIVATCVSVIVES